MLSKGTAFLKDVEDFHNNYYRRTHVSPNNFLNILKMIKHNHKKYKPPYPEWAEYFENSWKYENYKTKKCIESEKWNSSVWMLWSIYTNKQTLQKNIT